MPVQIDDKQLPAIDAHTHLGRRSAPSVTASPPSSAPT